MECRVVLFHFTTISLPVQSVFKEYSACFSIGWFKICANIYEQKNYNHINFKLVKSLCKIMLYKLVREKLFSISHLCTCNLCLKFSQVQWSPIYFQWWKHLLTWLNWELLFYKTYKLELEITHNKNFFVFSLIELEVSTMRLKLDFFDLNDARY